MENYQHELENLEPMPPKVHRCGIIEYAIEDWLFHYRNCCCCPMYDWYKFHMLKQNAHIRTYYENLGWLKVHLDSPIGVCYSFPAGLDKIMDVRI